jgi:hypothetical protein
MQAWVALFQFLSSLLLFPLNIIPNFGQLTIQQIPENMLDAAKCFLNLETSHADDNCNLAWLPVVGYAVCNFIFNITSLYVIKELSSAVVYIQNAIRFDHLPLPCIHYWSVQISILTIILFQITIDNGGVSSCIHHGLSRTSLGLHILLFIWRPGCHYSWINKLHVYFSEGITR